MDDNTSRERDHIVDLESGGTTSEEDGSSDHVLGSRQANKLLGRVWSGFLSLEGSVNGECGLNPCSNSGKSGEVGGENVELVIDKSSGGEEHMALVEKKYMKEKRKKANSKKPPRPPKGPLLDAADQKMVREISELAMKKRARIARMKTLKKLKAAKATSSNSSVSAMIITLLFCLVIIFQGICSRSSSSVRFQVSPEPAVATKGLISVQYYKTPSANDSSGPGSGSPNFVERASGSGPEDKSVRVAG